MSQRFVVIAAFATVYLIWGSTYFTIRLAIDTIPPFLMAGTRFLAAGLILYAFARRSGGPPPAAREWRRATIIGATLLLCGNGGVTFGELWVPTALTALIIALVPVFMAMLGWLSGVTARPTWLVWLGLACGLAGVALLVSPQNEITPQPGFGFGVAVILAAALIWSAGSLYAGRSPSSVSPFTAAGMQMICGGLLQIATAGILGEFRQFTPSAVSMSSFLAWVYLVFFGAILAYTAYSWLLQHRPPAQVATYAYVNPVVAVFLGVGFGGEKMTPTMFAGAALIVAAVAAVIAKQSGGHSPAVAASTDSEVAARGEG